MGGGGGCIVEYACLICSLDYCGPFVRAKVQARVLFSSREFIRTKQGLLEALPSLRHTYRKPTAKKTNE